MVNHRTKFSQIVGVLGLPWDDPRVRGFIADHDLCDDGARANSYPESAYFENPALGIALLRERGLVDSVFLHAEGKDDFHQYGGELPDDLSISLRRQEVLARLGSPSASGPAVQERRSIAHGGWDRFSYPAFLLHFTYAPVSELITLVTVSRLPS